MTDFIEDLLLSKVQLWGTLCKKPFGPSTSGKWQRRFFVIKEGYLLYYAENEKRDFERKRFFNMHPKGVIPLGGALFVPITDPVKMWSVRIDHDEVQGSIYVAADSENEREKWMEVMRKSSRVTWRNAELGETMIETLEQQSLALARDSQRYRDQWRLEAIALRDEMDRNEDLERLTAELEEEKQKIEETARELLEEHERTKIELEETTTAMQQVAKDQEQLTRASCDFKSDLEILAVERERTVLELCKREDTVEKLATENQSLSTETTTLKDNLKQIEDKTSELKEELRNIHERLLDKENEAAVLAEEKRSFSLQAQELESSLHDLTVQKEMTESELKDEIIARHDAERRLIKAEDSLARLDAALKESRPEPVTERENELDAEIFTNVAHLKRFFEDIALEAQLDANKPIIMKNALHARKSFVRKTKSFKFRQGRDKSLARHNTSITAVRGKGHPIAAGRQPGFSSFSLPVRPPNDMARYSVAMGNLPYYTMENDDNNTTTEVAEQLDLPHSNQLSGSLCKSSKGLQDILEVDPMPSQLADTLTEAHDSESSSMSSQGGGSKTTEESSEMEDLQIAFEDTV